MKRITRTEMTALSTAVMCCERFTELYTAEYISNLKEKYSETLKKWREQNSKHKVK